VANRQLDLTINRVLY